MPVDNEQVELGNLINTHMTMSESIALTADVKYKLLRKAKSGTWYDGWRPYRMLCYNMARMHNRPYGFHCVHCHNRVGFNLLHFVGPTLNIDYNY